MNCKTNEQKEVIYKCAEGLLKITHSLKNIDDDLSFKALQLSDLVLKLLEVEECCQSPVAPAPIEPFVNLTQPVQPAQPQPVQPQFNPQPNPSTMCNGHSNTPNQNSNLENNQSIENEVDYLVNKIRKELNK